MKMILLYKHTFEINLHREWVRERFRPDEKREAHSVSLIGQIRVVSG